VSANKPDIVLVHGMYMNGESWRPWVERASARGHSCHTPSWPYHDGRPVERRASIDPELPSLTFGAVVAHLKRFIETLSERPILIGHSVGGLVVQKLANDGYARLAVPISPAPPRGIISLDPHFYRANAPHLNFAAAGRPLIMSAKRFHYTFANTMTRADSDAAFERYTVPESRRVPQSTLTQAGIDFRRPHVPMLVLAGDRDHLTPIDMVRRNVKAYRKGEGTVDFQLMRGRSHLLCNQSGWEEVADAALTWIDKQLPAA
jgi:pimeloyl-ACP methyl ester carboxylesterase